MPQILDGKIARDFYKKTLIERVKKLSFVPTLSIIQIGDNRESAIYIEQKKNFGLSIGVSVSHIHLPAEATFDEIARIILGENSKSEVSGIIIQSPVPAHLDFLKLVNLIDPKRDVDGLTDENVKLLAEGKPRFVPATARGVMLLLDFYKISVSGKKIAVLGRSRLVGGPIARMLEMEGANVTVCHSKTANTREITKQSDIVIVAVGKPEFIDRSYVRDGAIVIDVGINSVYGEKLEEEIPKRKLVGDVDFGNIFAVVSAITPVPGGVGPMTVLSLFDNLISASLKLK
ncbi:MAG: bifunctional 5,10-methylenetetrahydrofolate dehydrogenase/5,10-methenyltetrahydrofolate cyclohydrolase [bacterium]|nr:bifunctional 5,10-methylenetetrahydrofolate dehydrogenase/5,10-methenyltetrahydrofolate cyclohydrolase [bacterium]